MFAQYFTNFAAAIGLPAILLAGVKGLFDYRRGKGERDKEQFKQIILWRDYAMRLWEKAWKLRAAAIRHKVPIEELEDIEPPPKDLLG